MLKPTAPAKRIALIDADGILFAAALRGETTCDGAQLQLLDISLVYKDCMTRIEEAADKVDADDAFIILSDRRNFRYDILPSYKGNRKGGPRPLLLDELRKTVDEEAPYKVMLIEGLEADDVCGIASGTLQASGSDPVIVSPDKDLLQIPGKVYQSVATNSGTSGKPTVLDISEEQGDDFHFYQMLAGDPVDGYKGCPGIGSVGAREIVSQMRYAGLSNAEKWAYIVECYEEKGLTAEDALVQARVSRILRVTDWDAEAKEPILWTPETD